MNPPFDPIEFLEHGPLVPFVMDCVDERVLWVGPQAESLLGYPRERWLKPDVWDVIVVEEDRRRVRDARGSRAWATPGASVEYRVRAAGGAVLWLTEVGRVVQDEDGARIEGYLLDVTERKNREVAIWRSEERVRGILRNAPDAMVVTDIGGRIQTMNAQAERLFQYGFADVCGSMLDPMVPQRLRAAFTELRDALDPESERRSLVAGQAFAIEQQDGGEVPVEIGMSLVTTPDGEVQILNSFRDLTARLRLETQLRSSERRIRAVAEALPALIFFVDQAERFLFVNDAYAAWHGQRRHQMEGQRIREVIGESAYADYEESISAALNGTPAHMRLDVVDPDGQPRSFDMSFVPQFSEDQSVDGFFGAFFDVSAEVRAEQGDRLHREQLAHVARVATLGELAASIAHELNQPLSAVVANAQAARRFLDPIAPDLDEAREALDDVAADARRAGDVIASMRKLLERRETRHEPVDLRHLALEVVELVRSEAVLNGVEVRVQEDAATTTVEGDPGQLTQVFLNLVKNAIESTGRLSSAPRTVTVSFSSDRSDVEVSILDNGPGFPAGDPESLFQPFFTRRPGGLGMGLPISRTIAEAHGGSVSAERLADEGALLRVRLPAAPADDSSA